MIKKVTDFDRLQKQAYVKPAIQVVVTDMKQQMPRKNSFCRAMASQQQATHGTSLGKHITELFNPFYEQRIKTNETIRFNSLFLENIKGGKLKLHSFNNEQRF